MSHYKPYPAYKPSGVEWIGQVPDHWEVKRLRHVANYTNSNVDKKDYEDQDAVSLCNYTDVYKNEFITPEMPFMRATASPSEIDQFTLKKGDVLITKDSEDPTDIGIPALVAQDMPGVVCGYHLTIIRADNLSTSRLVHRVLMSAPTKAHFFLEAPGITRYGLGQDAIGDLTVCLPPDVERSLIADRIDKETTRIDALISKKTRFIELLKEKRQALITHAVTKGIDPNVHRRDSGVEWIGEMPEHWELMRLRQVSSFTNSGIDKKSYEGQKQVMLCNYTDVYYNEFITPNMPFMQATASAAEIERFTLKVGDLIITKDSEDPSDIGIPALVVEDAPGVVCGYHLTLIRSPEVATSRLLHRVLQSTPTQAYFYIESPGITRYGLGQDVIGDLRVCMPPANEIRRIADYIDRETKRIDTMIEKAKSSIDLLKERRSAFITAAVTGQIDYGSLHERYCAPRKAFRSLHRLQTGGPRLESRHYFAIRHRAGVVPG
jgi:type I restriction enzyme S subunit